jgi:ribosome-binding protein aMBF1 (putative translation factor)
MKNCKICGKPAGYPHYVMNDGSVICNSCTVKEEIATYINIALEKIKKLDNIDKVNLVVELSETLDIMEDRDIEVIYYILSNIKKR